MATTFNMQDFNEILEKCRDQSQQKKQDQVNKFRIFEWFVKNNLAGNEMQERCGDEFGFVIYF